MMECQTCSSLQNHHLHHHHYFGINEKRNLNNVQASSSSSSCSLRRERRREKKKEEKEIMKSKEISAQEVKINTSEQKKKQEEEEENSSHICSLRVMADHDLVSPKINPSRVISFPAKFVISCLFLFLTLSSSSSSAQHHHPHQPHPHPYVDYHPGINPTHGPPTQAYGQPIWAASGSHSPPPRYAGDHGHRLPRVLDRHVSNSPPGNDPPIIRHPGTCTYQRSQSACTFSLLCYLAGGMPIEGCGGDLSVTCCALYASSSSGSAAAFLQSSDLLSPNTLSPNTLTPPPPNSNYQQGANLPPVGNPHLLPKYNQVQGQPTNYGNSHHPSVRYLQETSPNYQRHLPPPAGYHTAYYDHPMSSSPGVNHLPGNYNNQVHLPSNSNLPPPPQTLPGLPPGMQVHHYSAASGQKQLIPSVVNHPITNHLTSNSLSVPSIEDPLQISPPERVTGNNNHHPSYDPLLSPNPHPGIYGPDSNYLNGNPGSPNTADYDSSVRRSIPNYAPNEIQSGERHQYARHFAGEDVCGKPMAKPRSRIIGGQSAYFGEFPWQVHIKIAKHQCGGALVNRDFVVTAAHCVYQAPLHQLSIIIGAYDIEDHRFQDESPQFFSVAEVRLHPNFRFSASNPDRFDVAVLRLDKSARYADNVLPICLPPKGINFEGWYAVVTGWGKTDPALSNRFGTRVLQKVDVPIIKNDECENWHQTRGIDLKIFPEMFCAGYEDGRKDACVGDSGGPLVVFLNNRWTLAGLTSAGYGCGQIRQPGIYHRLSHTVDWVLANIV